MLDKAKKKDNSDTFYKEALRRFKFSEVNGICLGYAKGKSGAGFGNTLGRQVINTAYDIVKAGILDPEFFELLPLFQENVGADRLSDMIATLILDEKRFVKDIFTLKTYFYFKSSRWNTKMLPTVINAMIARSYMTKRSVCPITCPLSNCMICELGSASFKNANNVRFIPPI